MTQFTMSKNGATQSIMYCATFLYILSKTHMHKNEIKMLKSKSLGNMHGKSLTSQLFNALAAT